MKNLCRILLSLLLVFAMGKAFFMLYNHSVESFGLLDMCQVWWHGLTMDLSTSGYLLILPWLCGLLTMLRPRFPVRRVLLIYYIIISILLGLIIGGDAFLYPFWKFKLNATIFLYLGEAQAAVSSVSAAFIITRILLILLLTGIFFWLMRKTLPQSRSLVSPVLFHFLLGGLIFLMIRGGVKTSVMNIGVPYYSPRLFLNHSAVNPVFSLFTSITENKDFDAQFNYFSKEECEAVFSELEKDNPSPSGEVGRGATPLLTTPRPNILIILMESFGSRFVSELGGVPDVAPNLSRLIPQGIFWENYYSNSFRTDRGVISALSGWVSYPTVSLMQLADRLAGIPSLANSLVAEGYSGTYLYGGDIKFMGQRGYLVQTGYRSLVSDEGFTLSQAHESKWGVNDSLTSQRALQIIREMPEGKPWHLVWQTLSSHEPFEVPYSRFEDPVLNAFAFTDHCVGQLIDGLQALPQWKDMLVILIPDHGFLYDMTYQDPEFFHSPMLWLGGAVHEPCRMKVLMNQSDLAATLLGQMGLPHSQFPWSRNVLSPDYTYPFVYCNYPAGVMFRDSTGVSVYDTEADRPILEQPSDGGLRIRKAKAILQTSYDRL